MRTNPFSRKWIPRGIAIAVAAGIISSVVIVGLREQERKSSEEELAAAVTSIEAHDPDWQWDGFVARLPRPEDAKNGSKVAVEVKRLLPANWTEQLRNEDWLKQLCETPVNALPKPEIIDSLRKETERMRAALDAARRFRNCPAGLRENPQPPRPGRGALDELEIDPTEAREGSLLLLEMDNFLAIASRNDNHVSDNLLACLNVSRSIGPDPFLVSQVRRRSLRRKATSALERSLATIQSFEGLKQIHEAWSEDAEEPLFYHAVRGDRALYGTVTLNLLSGRIDLSEAAKRTGSERFLLEREFNSWRRRATIPNDLALYLRWTQVAEQVSRLPVEKQHAASAGLPQVPFAREYNLSSSRTVALESNMVWFADSAGLMRCAVAGIACERYRLRFGKWPKSLSDLCPDYLAAVPIDPSSGKPVRLIADQHGLVIRAGSVGSKEGIIADEGIAFQLWNPENRGRRE
jgi:hypothetical protein